MAGNARWTSYSDVIKHPEDSLLLAYLRKQQLEDGLSISQHIDVEKCPRCLHKLNELKQVSTTLDALGVMRSYQHYPELSVADTYARMQMATSHRTPAMAFLKGANHRQRPRRSVVRLISLPAAFGLAIFFTVAMLVFANFSGKLLIPSALQGVIKPSLSNSPVVIAHFSSPTPNPGLTATGSVEASATPVQTATSGPITKPYLTMCSTPANISQWRLVICGYNFDTAHKVMLFASGKKPMLQINLHVDQHGKFQFGWTIVNCSNLPTTIYSYEVTNSKPIDVKLQITSFGSCPAPTTTPIVGSSGVSPNYGK
jgi:hypothetical protein